MKHYLTSLALLLILVLAFAARWYRIDNPIADWHSFRQADTASVSRYFVAHGIDLLHPRYDDHSDIQSGQFNPEGYRMVEFPLYNALHATLYQSFPFWNLDIWGRVLSSLLSLGSIVFFYLILSRLSGKTTALIGAFLLAIIPFNVYYSRVILPEPLMVSLLLASTYFFFRFLDRPNPLNYLLSAVLLAFSFLTKPYAVFFTLPFFFLAFSKYRFRLLLSPLTYLFIIITAAPLLAWRSWITQFPAGIPASDWLLNFDNLRFSPAWFRWLFSERLGKLILGSWGLIPLALGLLTLPKKSEHWTYHLWLIGILIYFSIFAGGNIRHDYYQAIIIPFLVAPLAVGFHQLLSPKAKLIWPLAPAFSLVVLVLMLFFSWYEVRSYYQINNPVIISVGQHADQVLPKDAVVVAPYGGDTAFLYQINRPGFPAVTVNVDLLIKHGATHYVSVNYDDITNGVLNDPRFTILEKTPQYLIAKLAR